MFIFNFFKKLIIVFYNVNYKLLGKFQYDHISRKFLNFKFNSLPAFKRNYNSILNNEIFNYSNLHPFIRFQKSKILFNINPEKAAEEIKGYEILKKNWLQQNPKYDERIDYLPAEKITGAIGNYTELFNYLNYRYNIENKVRKPRIIIPDKKLITNYHLFKYFEKYLDVVISPKDFNKKRFIVEVNKLAIDLASLFNGNYYPHPVAANFVNQQLRKMKDKKFDKFVLTDEDREKGENEIKKFGVKKNDWYVLFHIRDRDGDNYRNSNPQTYLNAMQKVIDKGGWAIRVGRGDRYKFPKKERLIDYSVSSFASDQLDVFLAASCKFCVGTSSGFAPIPKYFGRPLLLTNCLPVAAYLELNESDIFLPKKLVNKKTKKDMTFKNYFSFPLNYYHSPDVFIKNDIDFINNSEGDISLAVEEMIDLVEMKNNKEFKYKNDLFRKKLSKELKQDFDYDLSHECNFSKSTINNFI